jgi:hypothetical protein
MLGGFGTVTNQVDPAQPGSDKTVFWPSDEYHRALEACKVAHADIMMGRLEAENVMSIIDDVVSIDGWGRFKIK